jgi:hypothetical protein
MAIIMLVHLCLVHGLTYVQFWDEPGCIGVASIYYVLIQQNAVKETPFFSPLEFVYYKEGRANFYPIMT